MVALFYGQFTDPEKSPDTLANSIPCLIFTPSFSLLPRIGKPEDCAGIVSFLCSEDASYITGETVVVAGGTQSHLLRMWRASTRAEIGLQL